MFKRLLPIMMLTLTASQAWATTTYYIGSGAFTTDFGAASLTSTGFLTFTGATGLGTSALTVSDVTFAGSTVFNLNGSAAEQDSKSDVTIALPASAYAIGLHLGVAQSSATWCVDGCSGGSFSLTTGGDFLIGLISDTPISSLTLMGFGGTGLKISDFVIGTKDAVVTPPVGDTPEPASMALMGGALAGLGIMVQRRKRRAGLLQASER